MSRQSYATSLTEVNADITVVGGQGAAVGDIREDINGNRFILVLTAENISAKRVAYFAGNFIIAVADTTTQNVVPAGVTIATAVVSDYLWLQVSGVATVETDNTLANSTVALMTTGGKVAGYLYDDNVGAAANFSGVGLTVVSDGGTAGEGKVLISPIGWYDNT
jgi:hypothetical protein